MYGIQSKEIAYDNGIRGDKDSVQDGLYDCF